MSNQKKWPAPVALDGEGAQAVELEGGRVRAQSFKANNICSTQAAQSPALYTQAEADRRQREARERIARREQQRQAARRFCQMQRGCVRRV